MASWVLITTMAMEGHRSASIMTAAVATAASRSERREDLVILQSRITAAVDERKENKPNKR